MLRKFLFLMLCGMALSDKAKIENKLQHTFNQNGTANIVINFRQSIEVVLDKINALRFPTRGAKITAMKEELEKLAKSSQKEVITLLNTRSASFESFWINNCVYVKDAEAELVNVIATISGVTDIREEMTIKFDEPIVGENGEINAEWNIEKIQAEEAWTLPGGNNGAGVVVSTIDTGVRYTHEALRNNFRSDYGWYDPVYKYENPIDQNGHGTHTMGLIAGSGNIGVAPGSQWITCRIGVMEPSESLFIGCGQWLTCPTKPDGISDPDCSKAPDVVSNSWGGGQGQTWFYSTVSVWHSAGIIPVFSVGNSGPNCESANSPGDLVNVIAVGSTNDADNISSFSSRGPARNGAIKPDISAPGHNIRSSWNTGDTAYNTISGTSMSAPITSGVVGLLKAHNRNLSYFQIKSLIEENAVRTGLGDAQACRDIPITEFPNNVYGHGRLNALNALSAAINEF